MFPDYLRCIENGCVATAKGFECGAVDANNCMIKEVAKKNSVPEYPLILQLQQQQQQQQQPQPPARAITTPYQRPKAPILPNRYRTPAQEKMEEVAADLQIALFNPDNAALKQAYHAALDARVMFFKKSMNHKVQPPKDEAEGCLRFVRGAVKIIRHKLGQKTFEGPGVRVEHIAEDPEIKEMCKYFNQQCSEVMKRFTDYFSLTREKGVIYAQLQPEVPPAKKIKM